MQTSLIKTIDLDFVHIEIYPDFLITTTKEGVVFDVKELAAIYEVFDSYFPGKNFGLIANRVNDYTVNPTCYMDCTKLDRLKGIAILSYNEASYNNAKFEKSFYKDLEAFYTLEECIAFIGSKL